MDLRLALITSFVAAICGGAAAVLEKITADKQAHFRRIHIKYLFQMLSDWPYVTGIVLDALAWLLTLVAVHILPLFVVQPIISFGVVITVLIEFFIMQRRLGWQVFASILLIFIGLAMIAITAAPEHAKVEDPIFKTFILLGPIPLAVLGSMFARTNNKLGAITLGALSGIGFGGTSITGRMLNITHPLWHILISPTFWSLAAYGIIGVLIFAVALQRQHASIINAASVTFDTLFPMFIGVFFLGDEPRNGDWLQVALGISLALVGTVTISLSEQKETAETISVA